MRYILVFILKLLENIFSTLRLIVINNRKKLLGAILQFITIICWTIAASLAIYNALKDPLILIVFAFSSSIGSYLGCIIEEKIALGDITLFIITDTNIKDKLMDYKVLHFENNNSYFYIITTKRKNKKEVIDLIKKNNYNYITIFNSNYIRGDQ